MLPIIAGVVEGGGVAVGLYFAFGYALNHNLEDRIDKKANDRIAVLEPQCAAGDSAACAEKQEWTVRIAPATRAKRDWTLRELIGPTFAYTFLGGYAQEHRSGVVSADLPQPVDANMHGISVDSIFRFHALRAEVGYQHMSGNLIGSFGDNAIYSETQAFDSIKTGLALQPGWHHLISPYLGVRYRVDIENGRFIDTFSPPMGSENYHVTGDRLKPALHAGRTLGTLGVTFNIPLGHHRVMFRGLAVNLETYRAIDDAKIDSGVILSAGLGAWAPSSVSALEGMTGFATDKGAYGNYVTATATWGGAGLEVMSLEDHHFAFTALDFWIKPSEAPHLADFGVAILEAGARVPLPGAAHAVMFKATPMAIATYTRDEMLGMSPPNMYTGETHPLGKLMTYGSMKAPRRCSCSSATATDRVRPSAEVRPRCPPDGRARGERREPPPSSRGMKAAVSLRNERI